MIAMMKTVLFHALAVLFVTFATAVPVEEKESRKMKRNGLSCNIGGYSFRHGALFVYPGNTQCVKYLCNNGGFNIAQGACDVKGQCVAVGAVVQQGCRSFKCVQQVTGNMHYFNMLPTPQDKCEANGRCVQKNVPFENDDCKTYQCIPTGNGGYQFRQLSAAKCRDDINRRCIPVGTIFAKYVNGHYYQNCVCVAGGGYQCRG